MEQEQHFNGVFQLLVILIQKFQENVLLLKNLLSPVVMKLRQNRILKILLRLYLHLDNSSYNVPVRLKYE